MDQTVNLTAMPSKVRILLSPRPLRKAPSLWTALFSFMAVGREGFEESLVAPQLYAGATIRSTGHPCDEANGRPGAERAEMPKALRTREVEGAESFPD